MSDHQVFAKPTNIASFSSDPLVAAGLETLYWSAASIEALRNVTTESNWRPTSTVPATGRFVAAIIAPIGQAATKARKFATLIGQSGSVDQLIDQGMLWLDRQYIQSNPPRIGFAFPAKVRNMVAC